MRLSVASEKLEIPTAHVSPQCIAAEAIPTYIQPKQSSLCEGCVIVYGSAAAMETHGRVGCALEWSPYTVETQS